MHGSIDCRSCAAHPEGWGWDLCPTFPRDFSILFRDRYISGIAIVIWSSVSRIRHDRPCEGQFKARSIVLTSRPSPNPPGYAKRVTIFVSHLARPLANEEVPLAGDLAAYRQRGISAALVACMNGIKLELVESYFKAALTIAGNGSRKTNGTEDGTRTDRKQKAI